LDRYDHSVRPTQHHRELQAVTVRYKVSFLLISYEVARLCKKVLPLKSCFICKGLQK